MVWRFDVGVGGDMVVVVVLVLVAEWGETCGVVFEHHQCQYQIQHIAWRPSSLPLIECHSPRSCSAVGCVACIMQLAGSLCLSDSRG